MLERRIIAMTILCLSLTMLFTSLLQVKRASYPPTVWFERIWSIPAQTNSTIDLDSKIQDVQISILDSAFENALINYSKIVIRGADNPGVKSAWFGEWRGVNPPPYVWLHTEMEAKEKEIRVDFEFDFPTINITQNSRMVIIAYVWGSPNSTWIDLKGTDINGSQRTSRIINLHQAYEKYFLYLISLREHSFTAVSGINVTYNCQPNNNASISTVFKMLNIFDKTPSVDGVPIAQGSSLAISLKEVEFPHIFRWEQLEPLNIFMYSTYEVNVSWFTTYNSVNYTWLVSNPKNVTGVVMAYLIMQFDRLTDAPIISAKISIMESGYFRVIDILGNITEAFSSQLIYPRFTIFVPNLAEEILISTIYEYWSSPWRETALFSCAIIGLEFIAFMYNRVRKR